MKHPGHDHPHHVHASGHAHAAFADPVALTKVLDDPARDAWQRPEDVVRVLELEPTMTVADVGAGTGYFSVRLARVLGHGSVLALELAPEMVRFLEERAEREQLPNLRAVQASPTSPGLAARSVDRILVVHAWHHLTSSADYARDLAAALRPGGRLLVVEYALEAEQGPPKTMRVAAGTVIAALEHAGLRASLNPLALPDQYLVEARKER